MLCSVQRYKKFVVLVWYMALPVIIHQNIGKITYHEPGINNIHINTYNYKLLPLLCKAMTNMYWLIKPKSNLSLCIYELSKQISLCTQCFSIPICCTNTTTQTKHHVNSTIHKNINQNYP